jgi:predicted glycosyltransferase
MSTATKSASDTGASAGRRVLIYSHDTMGLGHLRRCRTIAHSLVERFDDLSVLILSGSPIIGSFDFRARVDFVRVPGVVKLRNGEYTTLNLNIDFEKTIAMRASIIRHTAEIFEPDVFIVDKEPLGLRGEVAETLESLKKKGTRLVLGLRDVMDAPTLLAPEWQRKNVLPALRTLYDEIWVYGLPQMCEPLADMPVPKSVTDKMSYTGYLRRSVPLRTGARPESAVTRNPYVLVTPGGGDGDDLVEWVLRAYESDVWLPYGALIVLGPFMQPERQEEFRARAARLKRIEVITFDANMESLVAGAAGVVAMGGYNTFCEILSLDKRAIVVPRTEPRLEQYIRAARAQEVGLLRMLENAGRLDAKVMVEALREMPRQRLPSDVVIPGLLEGLESVHRLVQPWITGERATEAAAERADKRRTA